ncbi:MAG: hypothetical protein AAGA92_00920 [Planctomycetota bacterium]
MNLLGKIFTVLITVISIFVMAVSMLVYASHKNWQQTAQGLQKQLATAKASNDELESRYQSLDSRLQAELEAAKQNARKLETERVTLLSQNSAIRSELDQLRQKERANTAAVQATQNNNEKLTAEVQSLRDEVRENQQVRDEAFNVTVAKTDELHQLQGQLSSLTERNKQVVSDLATKSAVMRSNGLDPDMPAEAVVPRVRGVISATRRASGTQLIEITVGSDDGLKPGHTVEVFRGQRYLGRAEILETEPDKAVGRVIRRFQQGQIQKDDNVATKLRVG